MRICALLPGEAITWMGGAGSRWRPVLATHDICS